MTAGTLAKLPSLSSAPNAPLLAPTSARVSGTCLPSAFIRVAPAAISSATTRVSFTPAFTKA